jgi:hypothetical protein
VAGHDQRGIVGRGRCRKSDRLFRHELRDRSGCVEASRCGYPEQVAFREYLWPPAVAMMIAPAFPCASPSACRRGSRAGRGSRTANEPVIEAVVLRCGSQRLEARAGEGLATSGFDSPG